MQFLKLVIMFVATITTTSLAFSKRLLATPRIGGRASSLLSMRGGSTTNCSDKEKMFYALGLNVARQVGGELKGLLTNDELEQMTAGFKDSMTSKLTETEEIEFLQKFGPLLNEELTSRNNNVVNVEKQKGESFASKYLSNNPQAVKTSSGLIYHETMAGLGTQPTLASTVKVHYHGTLPDGKVFDSSVQRGEPIKFPLKNVIPGWQEGVAMMKPGGKATLVVPSSLGYGDQGSPPVIPPGATLQFEVELIEVM